MNKFRQLSPELWPLIDVILCSYIELIFRGRVSCLPAALLFVIVRLYCHSITTSFWTHSLVLDSHRQTF